MRLNTYLNFNGNCREAFEFYQQHLGAKIMTIMAFNQMPDPSKAPPGMEDHVLHARIEIAGTMVMASDMPPAAKWEPMRSAYLTLGVTSDDEAERVHAALSEGGEVFMAMQTTFYATRFSMLRDKFGVNWMVIHERPMPQPAQ
jgi:PhnB protein